MRRLFAFLSLLLIFSMMSAETIWLENFDDPAIDGKGATGVSWTEPPVVDLEGVTKWSVDIDNCDDVGENIGLCATSDWWRVQGGVFEGRDIDGQITEPIGGAIWLTETIDISGYSDIGITIDISSSGGFEGDDFIKASYQIDGGTITEFGNIQTPPTTFEVTGLSGSSLVVYVEADNGAGTEYYRFDNVTVTGTSGSAPDPEPTNHPSNFTATADGSETVNLSWDNNDGTVPADGFLVKCSTTSLGAITNPVDGVQSAEDTDMTDGEGQVYVMHGRNGYNWTGLAAGTTYYYAIYPYTNEGSNIDYNTTYDLGHPRPTASATTDAQADVIEFENFDSQTLGNWTQYSVLGDQTWYAAYYNGAYYAYINGYSGGYVPNEDWLISPALNFDNYTGETLDFISASSEGYSGDDIYLMVSNTYDGTSDPSGFTWDDLSSQVTWCPGGWAWTDSGTLDLSSYSGTVYIAFKYVSTTTYAHRWEIDDISIEGFFQGGNLPPQISNIATDPAAPGTSDAVTVRADVSDDSRSVSTVKCWWGTTSGSLTTDINMSLESGYTYATDTDIPAQVGGTTVYYRIEAIDNESENTLSPEYSYTVASSYTIHDIQGEAEASPLLGQIVTTYGIVTGIAYNGYYIQDGDGAWNGVWVYDSSNSPAIGDAVTLTATVAEYSGLTELATITSFNIDSSGNTLPSATVITTDGLTEGYEGVLVQVMDAVCVSDDSGNGQWQVDDGSGVLEVDDQMLFGFVRVAGNTYDITGIGNYSYSQYKIEPRDENDIFMHSDTEEPTIDDVVVVDENTIQVDFNEDVEESSAEEIENYYISSRIVTVSAVVRDDVDNSIVTLTVSGLVYGNYTIVVNNVEDLSGNGTDGASFNFTYSEPELIELVINEINYNPPEAGTDTLEFIEIYNAGDNQIDLEGFSFGAGVTYTFQNGDVVAAGDYFVVAVNATAFEAFYGFAADAEWTSGGLSNGGEAITLLGADAAVLDEVTYSDTGDWPSLPDGNGPSLELIAPSLDNSMGSNWSPSAADYGTPGAQNSVYNTDTVVRFNPGTGEYNEDQGTFDLVLSITSPSETVATTLDVVLITGDATDIDNYTTQSVTFPANDDSDQMVTITITDDTDVEDAETLYFEIQNISGGNNAAIGSPSQFELVIIDNDVLPPALVINEIMYNPEGTDDPYEFFEIYNAGTETVDMTGIEVTDGVSFTFPESSSIAAGEYIIVAFTAATYEGNGYQVFQWNDGQQLSNGGETIELRTASGQVIDSVEYDDGGDWPTACDGDGPSLELNGPTLDNSLAANWSASLVNGGTPGAENSVVGGVVEAPTDVVIVVNGSNIELDWADVTNAAQYHIYRGTDPENLTLIGSNTDSNFVDEGAASETMYFYKITADTVAPASRRR